MTDKEKLSCLIDRPCAACKFHNKDGCVKWSCVFEEKSELPEGEYIKKTDVLDKAVIETLSDYTEHEVVHVDTINKLPTYSILERKKGTWKMDDGTNAVCPICNKINGARGNFCKWCGSDMRGGKE